MTQPPQHPGPFGQDPYGQQGQPGQQQPGQPGQFGQPHQPGGYPQTGPGQQQPQQGWDQGWGGTPAQGFNPGQPYGQFDGNQGNYQGYPGQQPPKKTGLIVGLVVLGVLIVGGVVALILVLTNKDDNNSATGGNSSANKSSASSKPRTSASRSSIPTPSVPSTGGTGGTGGTVGTGAAAQPTPEALTSKLAEAYSASSISGAVDTFCAGQAVNKPNFLPVNGLTATAGAVSNHGDSAQLNVNLTGSNKGAMIFQAHQAGGAWCVERILDFQPAG